ncbi:hypothetical protein [Paenibacillus xanthanilyticus]|uniref:Uncharacterized protein n=1 Tax=Paenibacillus xanthanilyticus TaxID=1783531 RepID=A0ABV8K5I2_9BACL
MKKVPRAGMLLLLGAILTGCSDGVPAGAVEATASLSETNASAIHKLELGRPDNQHPGRYPAVAETTDPGKVQQFVAWMEAVPWENAEVSMSRPPDLKIVGTSTGVRETFAIWLSTNGRSYEVVVEGRSLYGKMSRRDSESLRKWIESSLS